MIPLTAAAQKAAIDLGTRSVWSRTDHDVASTWVAMIDALGERLDDWEDARQP
jgi:hypothetical protein